MTDAVREQVERADAVVELLECTCDVGEVGAVVLLDTLASLGLMLAPMAGGAYGNPASEAMFVLVTDALERRTA